MLELLSLLLGLNDLIITAFSWCMWGVWMLVWVGRGVCGGGGLVRLYGWRVIFFELSRDHSKRQ